MKLKKLFEMPIGMPTRQSGSLHHAAPGSSAEDTPRFRPDGGSVVSHPPTRGHAERRGIAVGHHVNYHYHDLHGTTKDGSGKVLGFVHNKKPRPGTSLGDVVIHDRDKNSHMFVAERNVRKKR